MKQRDPGFAGFGEAYFSTISAGAIKAWKRHMRMTMNLIVPIGDVRFVFRLPNAGDSVRVEEIGVNHYARITVPPGIWFGFQGIGVPSSLVLNIASIPHDPEEVEREPLSTSNYSWR
jgi:dTDP-4-dehydrorhamnose 3,5-epimerase